MPSQFREILTALMLLAGSTVLALHAVALVWACLVRFPPKRFPMRWILWPSRAEEVFGENKHIGHAIAHLAIGAAMALLAIRLVMS